MERPRGDDYRARSRNGNCRSPTALTAQKRGARQWDLPCPPERLRLQRIKECEQLLFLWFSELSESPGYTLGLASVPLDGIF
jgi:hypothetical protein